MQTFFESIHKVMVFYCKAHKFDAIDFWQKIIDLTSPFSNATKNNAALITNIFDEKKKDWVVIKDLKWNKHNLKKWLETGNVNYKLYNVKVCFPSIDQCYEKKMAPDILIKTMVKSSIIEKRYDFIFMLALANDFLKNMEKNEVNNALSQLENFLCPVFKSQLERPWVIKKNELEYIDELYNFFPSAILANGDEFKFREGYEEWSKTK